LLDRLRGKTFLARFFNSLMGGEAEEVSKKLVFGVRKGDE
jgi:hypothetical protein